MQHVMKAERDSRTSHRRRPEEYVQSQSIKRFVKPEEIADMCSSLPRRREDGDGQAIAVDGHTETFHRAADMPTGNLNMANLAPTRDRLGESILWHPVEEALYWIDFYGPLVHRQKWGGDMVSWKIDLGRRSGRSSLATRGASFAIDHGLHLLDTSTGKTRFFADPKNGKKNLAYNDGKVDRAGATGSEPMISEKTQRDFLSYGTRRHGRSGRQRFCHLQWPDFLTRQSKALFQRHITASLLRPQ